MHGRPLPRRVRRHLRRRRTDATLNLAFECRIGDGRAASRRRRLRARAGSRRPSCRAEEFAFVDSVEILDAWRARSGSSRRAGGRRACSVAVAAVGALEAELHDDRPARASARAAAACAPCASLLELDRPVARPRTPTRPTVSLPALASWTRSPITPFLSVGARDGERRLLHVDLDDVAAGRCPIARRHRVGPDDREEVRRPSGPGRCTSRRRRTTS